MGNDGVDALAKSRQTLDASNKRAATKYVVRHLFPNHEMMFAEHDTMAVEQKTTKENAPQAPEYFMVMASWVRQQTRK